MTALLAIIGMVFAALDMAFWQTARGRGFEPDSIWYILPGSGFVAYRRIHNGEAK